MRRPSPAMIVALVALFVALGGGAYAALKLPKGSVGSKQLKKHAVTPPKLSKATVKKLKGATGPPGVPGQNGDTGPAGPGAKGFRSDPAPTTSAAFVSLAAAGPYTLVTRCRDDGGGNVDATIAYAGPAAHIDFTSIVSTFGAPADPGAGGGDVPEGTLTAPVPLTTGHADTGGHTGTGSTLASLATGGQTVSVQVWAQARTAGGSQTDGCHFAALVIPVG